MFSPELDASAEEKEIIDLTGRLLSVIAAKDIKEYSLDSFSVSSKYLSLLQECSVYSNTRVYLYCQIANIM